ncbi:hypothetical protein GN316_12165 [Xylophilus sp. Kf1]|nr:hypothetical protein [Xylophilus sp. Kf1]
MTLNPLTAALSACAILSACGGSSGSGSGAAAISEPPDPAQIHYVAMGDSYSSGHGTVAHPDMSRCSRTEYAYGPLWQQRHVPGTFSFVACQGATTANVTDTPQHAQGESDIQLAALSPQTNMVTITIGGNDVGFAETAKKCAESEIFDRDTRSCTHRILEIQEIVDGTRLLPDNTTFYQHLLRTYRAIRAQVSPAARIFVMGYPPIYYLAPADNAIGPQTRRQIDAVMVSMNGAIAQAAAEAGVTYVAVDAAFDGHGAGKDNPQAQWINDISLTDSHISLHPNADGHALGDLPALEAAAGVR